MVGEQEQSVGSGLGMCGMVGGSVVAPTLLGTALGMWLDRRHPQSFSWTLTFLFAGLASGCIIAWRWVAKEHKEMHKEEKDE